MKFCLDLCSGLGGFSQAFVDFKWDVIRIDNNPKFKDIPFTIIADICDLDNIKKIIGERQIDIIIASPPCERFSIANSHWPQKGIGKAMEIVGSCLEIVVAFQPKYWALENPKGRLRWFLEVPHTVLYLKGLGYKTLKPTDLWGNIPIGLLNDLDKKRNPNGLKFDTDVPRVSSERAKMPYGLSQLILQSCID